MNNSQCIPYIVIMEDPIIHTRLRPFCTHRNCPCHQDRELLAELAEKVERGLLTTTQAAKVYAGKQELP